MYHPYISSFQILPLLVISNKRVIVLYLFKPDLTEKVRKDQNTLNQLDQLGLNYMQISILNSSRINAYRPQPANPENIFSTILNSFYPSLQCLKRFLGDCRYTFIKLE